MLGGLLGVRPGDRLLRYKEKHFINDDNDDDGFDGGDDRIVIVWMDISECKANLLTPSLMLGDCFATPMEGDKYQIQGDVMNFSNEWMLIIICIHDFLCP